MGSPRSPSAAPEPANAHWHTLPAADTLQRLQSTPAGLDTATAAERLQRYGPNTLPLAHRTTSLQRLLSQFNNVLIYVLLFCSGITALLGHVTDTLVILAVVVANAIIGFVQEGKAEQAVDAIRQLLAPRAAVLRDGSRHTIGAEQLVPGDIVLLEAGDKVPADLRLLQVFGLQAQEAILTGESVPVSKDIGSSARDAPLGDCCGMAFSGTLITAGQGSGVVVATGLSTEMGRISGLLATVETLRTPLVRKMEIFARRLTLVILLCAIFLLLFGYYVQNLPFDELFMAVVGLAVAAIPEGLPAVLTICLAIGVQAMARRNAIVRRLPALETIGSVSVICTDKTGTLTSNEMLVTDVVLADGALALGGNGYAPAGTVTPTGAAPESVLLRIAQAAALCNDSRLHEEAGHWKVSGDPMEGALLALAAKVAPAWRHTPDWQRVDVLPFDARHRYMATLDRDAAGKLFLFVKGAPEKLLELCSLQHRGNDTEPCATDHWRKQTELLAASGQRVLALAYKPVDSAGEPLTEASLATGLILLGLAGLVDPPRPETRAAIAECRSAGIRVKMITGDHASTAAAIAKAVGLQNSSTVLTGADIDALDDAALARILPDTDIFARTSPEHKLRLVQALQADGLSVAMTGDGVNDAPALKRADIGIAMGRKGSEAAKEAAKLVLADDNFASIVAAIREGRTVQDNLKKVISMTLPTSIGEAMTIIAALLFGLTLPITPVQILWVNLITEITLGIALAFEPTEPGTMQRPPRPPSAPVIDGRLAWYIVFVSGLFLAGVFGLYYLALQQGSSIDYARTMVVNALVMMEISQVFFIRNLYGTGLNWSVLRATPITWLLVLIVVAGQLLITYVPLLQGVFGTEPLAAWDLGLVLLAGLLTFFLAEADKRIRRRWQRPG